MSLKHNQGEADSKSESATGQNLQRPLMAIRYANDKLGSMITFAHDLMLD
jgi:hypothetical protein